MMIDILAVAFGPEPGRRASSGQQALFSLQLEGWAPTGARLRSLFLACRWWDAVDQVRAAAADVAAVVLLPSRAAADAAWVAAWAANDADPALADWEGQLWPGHELRPGGPSELACTLDPAGLAAAVSGAGLPTAVAGHPDRYLYNRALYTLLDSSAPPLVGMIHLPVSVESARLDGLPGAFNRMQIIAGAQAALQFAASSVAQTAHPALAA